MHKIKVFDISLTKSGFVIFLSESDGSPVLPIVIGISEAQSITLAMNEMKPERPLSHDLFKTIMDNFQASVVKVIINKYKNGTFFADLYLNTNDGALVLDSRPSDAIALAIRYKAPIYITDEIMNSASIPMPAENGENKSKNHAEVDFSPVSEKSILENRLQEAINREKFEEAALIRDQLKRLKS
jgi:uncharacterized protein